MLTNTRSLLIATLVILLGCLPLALADHLTPEEQKFIQDTAKGGMLEVHLAHMGIQKGTSQPVKSLARRLVDDHTKINHDLMELAQRKGVALSPDDPTAASTHPLAAKTGADFDQAFAKAMVEAHQKGIANFEKQAAGATDPDLKSFANNTLSTLRSHLTLAMKAAN